MTVTEYHIKLYIRVGGDVDHLQRIGTPAEKSYENQTLIVKMERAVADWEVVKKGLASRQFTEEINKKLNDMCSSDAVVEQMKQLSSFY